MAKIHTLTYNGTKSSDLGVFVSGSGSFDAAEFDVDKYEIPGRNGDLILSNNRYKNVEITYPAFIPKAFMDKVQNVRNWLRSSKVYARLEDTYDMDHYRLGIPTGVQSFSPENRNDGANFEITFDCKPQRFLKVGETPETVEADVQTESGEIVTFETVAESPITSASVTLSPIQSLNGYESPWPGGGGVNKLPKLVAGTYEANGGKIVVDNNGLATFSGTTTASGNVAIIPLETPVVVSARWYAQLHNTARNVEVSANFESTGYISALLVPFTQENCIAQIREADVGKTINHVRFWVASGTTLSGTFQPMFTEEATATTFSPYSNICPISGHTGAELNIAAEYDAEDNTTYSVTFTDQGTVYGGTIDFVTGEGEITWASIAITNINWTKYSVSQGNLFRSPVLPNCGLVYDSLNVLCSAYTTKKASARTDISISCGSDGKVDIIDNRYADAESFQAAMSGVHVQLVYELTTPITFSLSAQQLTTLQGQNVVWGAGPITLTYAEPYNVENPTLFDARPLFTVTNPAEDDVIMVNGQAITFVDGYTGTVFIDCETMNAYSGAANLNSIIQATDFPVLVPGTNIITWTGAGECKMTPRWWEL